MSTCISILSEVNSSFKYFIEQPATAWATKLVLECVSCASQWIQPRFLESIWYVFYCNKRVSINDVIAVMESWGEAFLTTPALSKSWNIKNKRSQFVTLFKCSYYRPKEMIFQLQQMWWDYFALSETQGYWNSVEHRNMIYEWFQLQSQSQRVRVRGRYWLKYVCLHGCFSYVSVATSYFCLRFQHCVEF